MKFSKLAWVAACMATLATASFAQGYPSRPIRLVVPFEAGGTPDTLARMVAMEVDKRLGTRVVVDNKPGANGAIGTADVSRAAPDGYTLLHVTTSFVINPLVSKRLPYDIERNFTPIVNLGIGTGYLLMASPSLPVHSVAELIAYARKSKAPISYSSPGVGNTLHLAGELFGARAGIPMLHIPYKGASPALNAVAAGDVNVMFIPPTIALSYLQSGKVRALAFTGERRAPELPQVPTMAQAGIADFVLTGGWHGWFAPAGTPPAVLQKIAATVRDVVRSPSVAQAFETGGYEPDGRMLDEFDAFVRAESQRYAEAVKRADIEPQ